MSNFEPTDLINVVGPRITNYLVENLTSEQAREACDIVSMVNDLYDAHTAKAWLFGSGAVIDGTSGHAPARAIREGHLKEARSAAMRIMYR